MIEPQLTDRGYIDEPDKLREAKDIRSKRPQSWLGIICHWFLSLRQHITSPSTKT